ncbi:unnamed protein product [Lathyrus sativus]|nr:unnamed protein product [Lathyrus sativus]
MLEYIFHDMCFSHGQLYVALSRGVSQTTTKVLSEKGKLEGEDGDYTKNVVFKQILLSHPQFFKAQERIDKGMYEELIRIFTR